MALNARTLKKLAASQSNNQVFVGSAELPLVTFYNRSGTIYVQIELPDGMNVADRKAEPDDKLKWPFEYSRSGVTY